MTTRSLPLQIHYIARSRTGSAAMIAIPPSFISRSRLTHDPRLCCRDGATAEGRRWPPGRRAVCRHAVRELIHGAAGQVDARREWVSSLNGAERCVAGRAPPGDRRIRGHRPGPGDRSTGAGRGPAVAGFRWPAAAGRGPRCPGEPAAHPGAHESSRAHQPGPGMARGPDTHDPGLPGQRNAARPPVAVGRGWPDHRRPPVGAGRTRRRRAAGPDLVRRVIGADWSWSQRDEAMARRILATPRPVHARWW
jgi:hypothetical protein